MKEEVVSSNNYELNINTKDWENGVYYYSIYLDGKKVETKKMILVK